MCKDGVLDMSCLVYADAIWGFDYVYIEIVELRTFFEGHREVLVEPFNIVFDEVDSKVGT